MRIWKGTWKPSPFFLCATLMILACLSRCGQHDDRLRSGPMVGAVAMREALVWVQLQPDAITADTRLHARAWPLDQSQSEIRGPQSTVDANGIAVLSLPGLEPGQRYRYAIHDGRGRLSLKADLQFQTKPLWKHQAKHPPDFHFALGSCHYVNEEPYDRKGPPFGSGYDIFSALESDSPQFFLWLGDNVYLREADWDSGSGIYHRYAHTRALKESQAFFARTPQFAIWDDHDFGPNDASSAYTLRRVTTRAFRDFWPDFNYPEAGIFRSFTWSDAEFFLLDNRSFRTANRLASGERTILGQAQKDWLRNALVDSRARLKFVVLGGQFLNSAAVYENYSNYAQERQEILQFLNQERIPGVVFLTGDRHHSEVSRMERPGLPALYDLTVSPLTAGTFPGAREDNRFRVPGSLVQERVYGLIQVTGEDQERSLQFSLKDRTGKVVYALRIALAELTMD